jgi:hypothetical protein
MNHFPILPVLATGLFLSGLAGCSTPPSEARTNSLQNRQDWMNSRAEAAADRRQIRSDNMDARTGATFDAL